MKLTLAFIAAALLQFQNLYSQKIGNWSLSAKELPVYTYTGKLHFTAFDRNRIIQHKYRCNQNFC